MWELDQKEGWASENWCFQIVVLEKTLESPNPKGNQPWIFTGWTECEAETPVLQPTDVKSWLTGEDSDAGKDWGQEKGMETEDEMVEHHRLNGHEFEQTPGDSEGEGSQACCSPGVAKSWTQLSNWTTARTPPPTPLHTVSAERIPVSSSEVAHPAVRAWVPITPLSLPCLHSTGRNARHWK